MEIIRKKICIEDFISRIPSNKIKCTINQNTQNSWGNIPEKFCFENTDGMKYFSYSYIMKLYYHILRLIIGGDVYENNNDKRILSKKEWRYFLLDYINNTTDTDKYYFISHNFAIVNDANFVYTMKYNNYDYIMKDKIFYYWNETESVINGEYTSIDKDIVYVINENNFKHLINEIKNITGNESIFYFIKEVHNKIGKHITPIEIEGIYVPLFFYESELNINNQNSLFSKIHNLKNSENLIDKKLYKEYGGDVFYKYLEDISKKLSNNTNDLNSEIISSGDIPLSSTTIDIPLLITNDLLDLGVYKVYNIEDSETTVKTTNNYKLISQVGESKISTLLSRRSELDDNGNVTIYVSEKIEGDKITYKELTPFKTYNIKNIQSLVIDNNDGKNSVYTVVGDTIISIETGTTTSGELEGESDIINNIAYTYVLGGKFKVTASTTGNLIEYLGINPFDTNTDKGTDEIDMYGIWYTENYNIEERERYIDDKKTYEKIININNGKNSTFYFLDKNHDIEIKNYPIFYDEKMLGLSYPLKEKYDVVIDRGSSVAFEKHLQLSEIKTMQDLENYRNGSLLNK